MKILSSYHIFHLYERKLLTGMLHHKSNKTSIGNGQFLHFMFLSFFNYVYVGMFLHDTEKGFLFCFFIQFNVLFKIISAHMRPVGRWGQNVRTTKKTTWHTRKQNMACPPAGLGTCTRHSIEMIKRLCVVMKSALSTNQPRVPPEKVFFLHPINIYGHN